MYSCELNEIGSRYGPVMYFCEHGDEISDQLLKDSA
jgi:hypothetical protein